MKNQKEIYCTRRTKWVSYETWGIIINGTASLIVFALWIIDFLFLDFVITFLHWFVFYFFIEIYNPKSDTWCKARYIIIIYCDYYVSPLNSNLLDIKLNNILVLLIHYLVMFCRMIE